MKTKLNFLMILMLVVNLAFNTTGAAAATSEETLTIGPDTLAAAAYQTPYSQQLTADGGTEPYTFTLFSGTLPSGITLSSDGELSGYPDGTSAIPDTYSITIDVRDAVGGIGSRNYDLVLVKGTPVVTLDAQNPIYWGSTFNISAQARMYDSSSSWSNPPGTVAFTIDGIPVPGCEAVIPEYQYTCPVSMDLSPGVHNFVANYTPLASNEHLYNSVLSDSGTFTISPGNFSIAGTLFRDSDQDGVWNQDAGEYRLEGAWTVNLDQGCDGTADYTDATDYWSSYQFSNIPGPYCYRITVVNQPGYQQTTTLEDFQLTGDLLSKNIGFYSTIITLSPSQIPSGNVGTEYSQTFTASGGVEPYAFTITTGSLPAGLTLSNEGVLSGTPTAAGDFSITVQVEDANQASRYEHYELIIKTDGAFTFMSSSNPSSPGDPVTFTVSATGDAFAFYYDRQVPPMGVVTFSADGNPIEDCSDVNLNIAYDNDWNMLIGAYPATCTTAALETGTHQITARFNAYVQAFNVPTLALTQTVQVAAPADLSIGPDTLLGAEYNTAYSQQLTASGGTPPYTFSYSGTLPYGITLDSSGLLSGYPDGYEAAPGTYPITIQVVDSASVITSRNYDLVIGKGTPTVIPHAPTNIYWNKTFNLWAEVQMDTPYGYPYSLSGTAAFTIDGTSVSGCGAVPVDFGHYTCEVIAMVDLSVGTHTWGVAYTPSGGYENYYTPASASSTFTVNTGYYTLMGSLFNDFDNDGVWDTEDYGIGSGWTVNLDQGCDETVDNTFTIPAPYTMYQFSNIPGGTCLRITIVGAPGWQQSTTLEDFWLSASLYSKDVGFYRPTITFSPETLPSGSVGQEYNQALTASGGAAPYTITLNQGDLPDGLTLSTNGILSGTPTAGGSFSFTVQAVDANNVFGLKNYHLFIKTDGVFTFTSSLNPSAPGDLVTFTLSATGDVVDPYYGSLPPVGWVTFYADGTPIEDCSDLNVNFTYGENGNGIIGDYPAACTTAALGTGIHEITAAFKDYSGVYNTPTLILSQQVGQLSNSAPTANPGGPYLGAISTAIAFDGSLSSDPDGDALTYAWDFGDGTTGTEALFSHSYSGAAIYDVCLTVNDGSLASEPACTIAVVYDPSAGFVTGGGWIDSPTGAYKADESLTGKATFGFVSKYQKGAKVPGGNTEFQFEAGGFKFYSSAYDWLVVSKDKVTAQFKGSGTVNETLAPNGSAYKFMLWAGDGVGADGADTFRIRIWWEDADAVEHDVYDNGFDQAIGAGNIVVHTGK